MSLENWARNNWLEQRGSDAAEIARLLALADGRLQDYRRAAAGKLSADVQLFQSRFERTDEWRLSCREVVSRCATVSGL
jgi:hypothetical protein